MKVCEEHDDCVVVYEGHECPICQRIAELENESFEEQMGNHLRIAEINPYDEAICYDYEEENMFYDCQFFEPRFFKRKKYKMNGA